MDGLVILFERAKEMVGWVARAAALRRVGGIATAVCVLLVVWNGFLWVSLLMASLWR
jgi:hypothetical protein